MRDLTYDVDDLRMVAHLALPTEDGPWPAVLIGHDGIGLEGYARSRADDLARRGYAALAMDYHGGRTYFGEPDAMLARVVPLISDPTRMRAIGRAALAALSAVPGVDGDCIGAVGYGAGASILLELARSGVGFKGLAAVHPGLPEPQAGDWIGVPGSFLLCTGSDDPICSVAHLLEFADALQDAGADWRVHVYGGAKHAFWALPRGSSGAPAARGGATVPGVGPHRQQAARAWRAVVDLLDETTRGSGADGV